MLTRHQKGIGGLILETSKEDLCKFSFPKKGFAFSKLLNKIFLEISSQEESGKCAFLKLLWKDIRKHLGKYVGKHQPYVTKESCIIITKFLQKYAMLTLSLDVICDVIYFLHHYAVKSAMKPNLHLVNFNNEAVRKLCFPLTYQDKKFF